MASTSQERLHKLVEQIEQDPGLAEQIPSEEGAIVRDALSGQNVYEIAQNHQVSEEAVWNILRNTARQASGQPITPYVTAGEGSDTEPGINGGYGDTAFGNDDEPPTEQEQIEARLFDNKYK